MRQVRYRNEAGAFNPTGLAVYERSYCKVFLDTQADDAWELDPSLWLAEGLHPGPVHEAIARELTPETRLAILWIKDRWARLPSYRHGISSIDIYDVVLQHGIRTPAQLSRYLLARGRPAEGIVEHD